MTRILRDRRYALSVILTIGLALAAVTTLTSAVKAVLLTPLPYRAPDRLVMIWKGADRGETTWLSMREVIEYRGAANTLERVEAYVEQPANFTGGDYPERVAAAGVTAGLFDALGVPAAIGRGVTAGDGQPGAAPVVVLAHGLWLRRFGGDPAWIGRTVEMNGVGRQIVGVMPAGFGLPRDFGSDRPTEAWVPLQVDPADAGAWGNRSFLSIARLRAGVSPADAAAELAVIARRWIQAGYVRDTGDGALFRDALPLDAFVAGHARQPLLLLLGAVVAVLLIACANVANLQLARADVRRRELATRSALGASRAELLRQLLGESLLLAAIAGAVGVALAAAAIRVLARVSAASLPRAADIGLDGTVLLVAGAAAMASGLLSGAAPAWRLSRADVTGVLNEGGRSGLASRGRHRFRQALVVAQLAGSVVLLVGAGLLVRSLVELSRIDLGFDDHQVLTAQLQLPASDYPEPADVVRFYRDLDARLTTMPGVEAAGAVRVLPLSRTIGDWSITIEGRPIIADENPNADFQAVTPGYFAALRLPLIRGRYLTTQDREGQPIVAVVNQVMADRYWPGEDVLGRRFHMGTADQPWVTVVGVIGQVRHNAMVEAPRAEMYLAHAQLPDEIGSTPRAMAIVVRTAGDPLEAADGLRTAVSALDRRLPVADLRPMAALIAAAAAGPRFTTLVLGAFALLALLIAAVGIYGTIALLVSERRAEFSVRVALGAAPASVVRMVVGQGLALTAAGLAVGLLGAALASRAMSGLAYGVAPLDPVTFTAVPALLAAVALAACAGPARRAGAADPAAALRS